MSIFKSLLDVLKPLPPAQTEQEFTIPLGLTGEEWKALKYLRGDDGWETFLKALDNRAKLYGENLLSASADVNVHFIRGLISGIREAGILIDTLKREEEAFLDARKRSKPAQRTGHTSALYGSPGWTKPDTSGVGRPSNLFKSRS